MHSLVLVVAVFTGAVLAVTQADQPKCTIAMSGKQGFAVNLPTMTIPAGKHTWKVKVHQWCSYTRGVKATGCDSGQAPSLVFTKPDLLVVTRNSMLGTEATVQVTIYCGMELRRKEQDAMMSLQQRN